MTGFALRTGFVTLLGLGFGVALIVAFPEHTDRFLEAMLLFAGAIAMLTFLRVTWAAESPAGNRILLRGRRGRDPRPEQLARLERVTALAGASKFDVHYRLRPVLREIATARLARRGVDLDEQPEQARALLGDALWELVRPERHPPHDRHAPGLSHSELRDVVAALEQT